MISAEEREQEVYDRMHHQIVVLLSEALPKARRTDLGKAAHRILQYHIAAKNGSLSRIIEKGDADRKWREHVDAEYMRLTPASVELVRELLSDSELVHDRPGPIRVGREIATVCNYLRGRGWNRLADFIDGAVTK